MRRNWNRLWHLNWNSRKNGIKKLWTCIGATCAKQFEPNAFYFALGQLIFGNTFTLTDTINHEAYRCDCQGGLYDGVDCKEKRDFCKEAFDPCENGASCKSIDDTLVSWYILIIFFLYQGASHLGIKSSGPMLRVRNTTVKIR